MIRGILTVFAALSLILLAGCGTSGGGGIGVDPEPFPNDNVQTVSVQPTFGSDPVRQSVTLSSGQSIVFRAEITSTVAQGNDVVYFDAVPAGSVSGEGALEVTAYSVDGSQVTPILSSTSQHWFGRPSDPGLAAVSTQLSATPASVSSDLHACGGPCVVVPTPDASGTAYVRVTALQSITFDLYVVATDLADTGEPNDSLSNAETVLIGTGSTAVVGAIELINDTDWYVTNQAVSSVLFTADTDNDLRLRAQVYDAAGNKLTLLFHGDSYATTSQVLRVEVFSDEDQPRAGASGRSTYSLDFQ